MKIIMTKGLPGSGKSTWAKITMRDEPGKYKRINKDDLRNMVDNGYWSRENEKFILSVRDILIISALKEGFNVIVDDTNLAPKHKKRLEQLARENKADFEVKDFTDTPIEICIKNDLKRPTSVGEKVIRRMYNQFLKPDPEKIIKDVNLPNVVICDIDGTLALFNGKNPYERDFINDTLNESVAELIRKLSQSTTIIYFSGRKQKHFNETASWLAKNNLPNGELFMRQDEDVRHDYIMKKELYEKNIKGKYNVLFVVDDRNQVVEMWRQIGLTCLQVADGDF